MAWIIKLVLAACMLNAATATYVKLVGSTYIEHNVHGYKEVRINLTEDLGDAESIAFRIASKFASDNIWEITSRIIIISPHVLGNSSIEPTTRTLVYDMGDCGHRINTIFVKGWGKNYIDFIIRSPGFSTIKIELFK